MNTFRQHVCSSHVYEPVALLSCAYSCMLQAPQKCAKLRPSASASLVAAAAADAAKTALPPLIMVPLLVPPPPPLHLNSVPFWRQNGGTLSFSFLLSQGVQEGVVRPLSFQSSHLELR